MTKNGILVEVYELFSPTSNSRTDFEKRVVYVKDIDLKYSPVTLARARRALGIATERIAGKPAWLAPTIALNHAIKGSITSQGVKWENRKDRMGERLTVVLKEFLCQQGLAAKCSTAKEELKAWRIKNGTGRGFPFYAFSRAVKNLELDKVDYEGAKYYLLQHNSSRDEGVAREFEELISFIDSLFSSRREVSEKEIITSGQSGGNYYHRVAILQALKFGYRLNERGMWCDDGVKNTQIKHMDKSLDPSRRWK
jgi:hypothetical protein